MTDTQDGATSAPAGDQAQGQDPNAAKDQTDSAAVTDTGSGADTSNETTAKEPADEAGADESEGKKKPKSDIQKAFDRLTRQKGRLERENASMAERLSRLEGRIEGQQPAAKSPNPDAKPRLEDFGSYDEWQDAVTDWKVDQKLKAKEDRERQTARQRTDAELHQQRKERFMESSEKAAEKYDDFEDVVYAESNKVSPVMAALIADTDDPGEVAYFLAKNPKEAQRIASLHPMKAANELGKLEVKLQTPPPKKISAAPDPAKAPSGGGGGQPRKLENLSQEDFYERRKKQISGR